MEIDNIKNLITCKIIDIGRVIDLCWIIFEKEEKYYSLHLQCPWRIRKDNKIVLSNMDIYEWEGENGEEWNEKRNNFFDETILKYNKWNGVEVENVIISDVLDIKLILSDSYIFECFVDDIRGECWRFFEKKALDHLVVWGKGIEQ